AALLGLAVLTPALADSDSEALALFAQARRGNAIAQYNLGLAYAQGQGVTADPIEAFVWLSLARENGAHGQALEDLSKTMTADQLTQARARLAERRQMKGIIAPAPKPEPVKTEGAAESIPGVRLTPAPGSSSALQRELDAAKADKSQLSGELAKAWDENE